MRRGIIFSLFLLLLIGCRSTERAVTEGSYRELRGGVTLIGDTLGHRYEVAVLRTYAPSGVLVTEEEHRSGEVREVRTVLKDTLTVYQRDTLYIREEGKVSEANSVQSFGLSVWGIAALLALVCLAVVYVKHAS